MAKGKTTVVDIAHGLMPAGGGSCQANPNFEPLMLELIRAVRDIDLKVDVPVKVEPPYVNVPQNVVNVPAQEMPAVHFSMPKAPFVYVGLLLVVEIGLRIWAVVQP